MKQQNSVNPTLLVYAILGLTQKVPQSGYEIRKTFEESALGNYSSSPGTIYPALKRMEKGGLIKQISIPESTKIKYTITNFGKKILKEWLTKPLTKEIVAKRVDELLLRFAFMDPMVTVPNKLIFLSSFLEHLNEHIKELDSFHQSESKSMPINGRLAFEHGILSSKATRNWCRKAITKLKNTN